MFSGIVGRYDLLNRLLSLGLDRRWRRLAVAAMGPRPGGHYRDVGTGTGDLLVEVLRQAPGAQVVGVDLAVPMLAEGRRKLAAAGGRGASALLAADGLHLPFAAASFEGGCSAFVVRNVEDRSALFRELDRVLRPGAWLSLLELTRPGNPILRLGHGLYLRLVVPSVGRVLSSASAYRYLAESIRCFPDSVEVQAEMGQAGFRDLVARPLSGGVVTLFVGRKPRGGADGQA
jgi:demethylmenaquinone methyltransferase/2-methoxy-6-polyprenyl-1,4-benzoquinol methylase